MKNSEIVDRYLRRNTSISILAQLNDCSTDVIIDILKQEGVVIPEPKPHKKTGPKPKAKEEPKQELPKIPKRLAGYHQKVIDEIQEEISIHVELIDADEKAIRDEQKRIKQEIDRLARSLKDFEKAKKGYIEDHKKAVEELNTELEEEKQFYKAYKGDK